MKPEKTGFSKLLTYDQDVFDGWMHGPIELYFKLEGQILHIRTHTTERCQWTDYQHVFGTPLHNQEEALDAYLLQWFSKTNNFCGYPEWVEGPTISKKRFNRLMELGSQQAAAKRSAAKQRYENTPLVNYCKDQHLRPEPVHGATHTWLANCESGRPHSMQLDVEKELWYCGYCRKGGDLDDLKKKHTPPMKVVSKSQYNLSRQCK